MKNGMDLGFFVISCRNRNKEHNKIRPDGLKANNHVQDTRNPFGEQLLVFLVSHLFRVTCEDPPPFFFLVHPCFSRIFMSIFGQYRPCCATYGEKNFQFLTFSIQYAAVKMVEGFEILP